MAYTSSSPSNATPKPPTLAEAWAELVKEVHDRIGTGDPNVEPAIKKVEALLPKS